MGRAAVVNVPPARVGKLLAQPSLDRTPQRRPLMAVELQPLEDQPLDPHVDLHVSEAWSRKSASLTGNSSLRNSTRAISSTSSIVTLLPLPAAQ